MEFLEISIYRIIMRTYMYLDETGRKNSFERFPYLRTLTGRLTEEALRKWQHSAGIQAERYRKLIVRIMGKGVAGETARFEEDVLCTLLDLCLAVMYVPEFAAYLNYYTGNMVTVQLAFDMEGVACPGYGDAVGILKKIGKICRVDWKKSPLLCGTIQGDNFLLAYLTGKDGKDRPDFRQAEWFERDWGLHPMFIRQKLAEEGAQWMREDDAGSWRKILHISGKGGRRFLVKHTARLMGKDLLFADAEKCRDFFREEGDAFWDSMACAAFLQEAAACIYGITAEVLLQSGGSEEAFLTAAVRPFLDRDIPVFLCSDSDVRFVSHGRFHIWNMELRELSRQEREMVFSGFAGLYDIPGDCQFLSARCRLSASEIAKAVRLWRWGRERKPEEFIKVCDGILYSGKKPLGKLLYPSVKAEDLKVPPHVQETLGQICCSVREGYRIFEEWNLKQQYPYGRAVTVLLVGPPGTGKTMTAHVVASELGFPLYQVDLSQVADKYVGETEKHLNDIFAFAERTNPVLFFDEADSLFGKRGQTEDGRDRYANMEVSYILQRIEQFEGIVILATNFYNNIDKAFLRRMKYVVKYEAPDEGIRRSIWSACLPAELPREELDMDYLAQKFDFTGGMIKNAVYTACVMALHEGRKLCMEHVLKAVRAEYVKTERMVTEDMWGEYGHLLMEADKGI